MIQDIIRQSMQAYEEHVTNRMSEIPVGAILCVHYDTNQNIRDDWKIAFVIESHIVPDLTTCDKKGRTVYGPKPKDWPTTKVTS